MKHLYTSEATGLSIVIFDDKNFGVGKVVRVFDKKQEKEVDSMQKLSFYNSIEGAMQAVAHIEAIDGCTDLKSYIRILVQSLQSFREAVAEALAGK
jgi:formate dehydrogenase maturation protein FdhE